MRESAAATFRLSASRAEFERLSGNGAAHAVLCGALRAASRSGAAAAEHARLARLRVGAERARARRRAAVHPWQSRRRCGSGRRSPGADVHIRGADVHMCAQCRRECGAGGCSLGADVAGARRGCLGADVAAVGPVPAQVWQGYAERRCRCGRRAASAEARRAVRAGRFRASGRAFPRRVCEGRCAPSVRRRACTTPRRPHTRTHTHTLTLTHTHVTRTHTQAHARAHTHTHL